MVSKTAIAFAALLALVLILSGCGREPTPVPTALAPADTPQPTPAELQPTDTPQPTATAVPTEILPTDTPQPTATAVPTEIPPTDTPRPTATAVPTEVPPTDTPQPTPTAVPTEVAPTDTPVPALTQVPPTAAPKPTVVPTEAPPPPPPPSQGCYLFQNFLGAEVSVTLTARDWQWSDTFVLAPGGEKSYCLDPGRYTFTLDAPPPWGSTNGDLTVQAGDRYLFPIRGRE